MKNDLKIKEFLIGAGVIAAATLIMIIVLLPLVGAIIFGECLAVILGLGGPVWWLFMICVIILYFIMAGIFSVLL